MNTQSQTILLPDSDYRDVSVARRKKRHLADDELTDVLLDIRALTTPDLLRALSLQGDDLAPIEDTLQAHGMVSEKSLIDAMAICADCDVIDLANSPPDPRLIQEIGVDVCLELGFVPWRYLGSRIIVVTARPRNFRQIENALPPGLQHPVMALAPLSEINRAIIKLRRNNLVHRAETRVPEAESCRTWHNGRAGLIAALFMTAITFGAIMFPLMVLTILTTLAILAVMTTTLLKAAAAFHALKQPVESVTSRAIAATRELRALPKVSILVPMFKEKRVTSRLLRRLSRLNYPRELLDICLVAEEDDRQTLSALDPHDLPGFIRTIVVPNGTLRTKPRAMNFALDFCKGSIVGVLDAEDAPEPEQIYKVVRQFENAADDVVCLQGILDFYNAGTNWLSRCFAIEYAAWFRVILPGLSRMGVAVPLGGTTLYMRKDALVATGAWDAHNVTEDADLGIRLARKGFRCELFSTVTEEEANCRFWPWVKQRARWLKGYSITWAVHMKDPARLMHDLGPRRFWGFQALFLGTILHFALAPLLWSFWVIPFGITHPIATLAGSGTMVALFCLFIGAEIVNICVNALATRDWQHRWLWKWIPTLHLYFPLASLAGYRAFWQLMSRPFHWDKTEHGASPRRRALF